MDHTSHDHPLVSCLMVTLAVPGRLQPLKRSLGAYCRQTYANRELVVVIDARAAEDVQAIRQAVDDLQRRDIRVVVPSERLTLGALRNVSVREACGELACTWDDDDLCHPERLERQVAALQEAGTLAVACSETMQFIPATRQLFLTNYTATPPRCLTATLLWRKSAPTSYPETGPESGFGEDSAMMEPLLNAGSIHFMAGLPHLYVYFSHGQNTGTAGHHAMLINRLAISKGLLLRREAVLRAGLAVFDFGPGDVVVEGSNGTAFTIAGSGPQSIL